MDLITGSLQWCKGEIFEGRLYLLFGICVCILALIYWKTGSTAFAKAMFIPFLLVGLLACSTGLGLIFTNEKRTIDYQQAFASNPSEFISSEKARTEGFIKWYPYTMYGMSILIIAGMALFLLLPTASGRAYGLAIILLGFSILFLDHFSEERAHRYHSILLKTSIAH
ncbi:MAG: hypothetical protein KBT88_10330 [Gammaproteobacteria bacterium]|nr:hypothetical protein [Gammaproteobacteria bacterium]MBQ0840171.1 hypothetical protein [Gammaproteobacteria bacterium]